MVASRMETSVTAKRRRDGRMLGILLTLSTVVALGWLIAELPMGGQDGVPAAATRVPDRPVQPEPEESVPAAGDGPVEPAGIAPSKLRQQLNQRFQQAVLMLHAQRYGHALVALDTVLSIDPNLPEAYINAGFALIGLERYQQADQAFSKAMELRPQLSNAYYGLAVALEGQGQIRGAVGAMQIYLHRADPQDAFYRKAQSAIWEWQERLQKERINAAGNSSAEQPMDQVAPKATG